MNRISLKITGAQGQGVNSVGEMCAKGLKRAGYCVFGYREYMSLIKGGHSSYQLDISSEQIRSSETKVDLLVCFNHHGLESNVEDVKEGGVILHQSGDWVFDASTQKSLEERGVRVMYLPVESMLAELGAKPIFGNALITAVVWAILGQKSDGLKALVAEQFGKKGKEVVALNERCIDAGIAFHAALPDALQCALPIADARWRDHLLLTGSEAMGLGIIRAGCRLYAGYPMTPSSPLLTYIASVQNETGMVVKQAEDEITAAQMMSGANFMGTRAITATSGGGFDLMTETLSLNGMIENPSVFVLAQRPGPATGLPTWTAQGDLFLAIFGGHGEFARLVLSVSDSGDAFALMPEAFNFAEEFQIPVIVLTDKHIAEGIYTEESFEGGKEMRRGRLVTDPAVLKKLKSADRYDPSAPDGVSPRWLPGSEAATYCAQGDEHSADGSVDETAANAKAQMEKRLRKMDALRKKIPAPLLTHAEGEADLLIVSWGSTKGAIEDAIRSEALRGKKVAHLHYQVLWPLDTETLAQAMSKASKTVIVESNATGQLRSLIRMESGISIPDAILQYDGRPFFVDELTSALSPYLP